MYCEVCAVVLAVSGLAVGHNVYNLVYRQLYTALALFQQLQRLQHNISCTSTRKLGDNYQRALNSKGKVANHKHNWENFTQERRMHRTS